MTSLYSREEAKRLEVRTAWYYRITLVCAAAAFVFCVTACFFVRTDNAAKLQGLVTIVSASAGCALILLLYLGYFPAKAEQAHMRGILSGTPEEHTGQLTLSDRCIQIPKSIQVRQATLLEEGRSLPLTVNNRLVPLLPRTPCTVRIHTVRSFITAVEPLSREV